MSIAVDGIRKRFGEYIALQDVAFEVQTGQLAAILGPSGCGKTTLLRIIAGLETPDAGRVFLQGREATDLPVARRRVGFVFQHYALFRHMTVFDNVAFGLTVRRRPDRPSAAAIRAKVEELLALVQLEAEAGRRPAQLSGGQRQRVALARALAVDPEVLLLDEPFGALDTQVRQELRRWLRRLHDALHFTSLFVTHDQTEAFEVADSILVMNHGRIEQRGTPEQVYDEPATAFVHSFVGTTHELPARREAGVLSIGPLPPVADAGPDGAVRVVMRPQDLVLGRGGDGWRGRVLRVRMVGPLVHVDVALDGEAGDPLVAELPGERYRADPYRAGEVVLVRFGRYRTYPQGDRT
ncbi:MAG: TOBE-like domain-containing protein [Deltaproteobacteria bacterium]